MWGIFKVFIFLRHGEEPSNACGDHHIAYGLLVGLSVLYVRIKQRKVSLIHIIAVIVKLLMTAPRGQEAVMWVFG